MRNIVISNLVAYNTGNYSSSITAIPGHYVENVSLSNIQLFNRGAISKANSLDEIEKVKEDIKGYPQPTTWKELPSSGLFIRHAKNIQVRGLMLNSQGADARTPVIAVDVDGLQIESVSKIHNSLSDVFFKGLNVTDVDIQKPLGWQKQVAEIK